MKTDKLALLAFIAIKAQGMRNINQLYSYTNGTYYSFGVNSEFPLLSIYDYKRGNYISGNKKPNGWIMFDYADGNYIDFSIQGTRLRVFDYKSSVYYDISIQGRNIVIFSYEDSTNYTFSY